MLCFVAVFKCILWLFFSLLGFVASQLGSPLAQKKEKKKSPDKRFLLKKYIKTNGIFKLFPRTDVGGGGGEEM